MADFIWHNPRCSKSRQTLELLRENHVEVDVVEYLKTPPSADTITAAAEGMGCRVTDLIRSKEALFKELGLSLADERSGLDWAELLHQHPKLIERPVVCVKGRYAMGRPPEKVLELL